MTGEPMACPHGFPRIVACRACAEDERCVCDPSDYGECEYCEQRREASELAFYAEECAPAMSEQGAWLVECPKYHPGEYFALCECGCGRHHWTSNVHKATKFATKEEAETARGGDTNCIAVDHLFGLALPTRTIPAHPSSDDTQSVVRNRAYWEWPHGDAGDAIDFACDHCSPDEALAFLNDWRADQADGWPGYMRWLKVQQDGAKASALEEQTPGTPRSSDDGEVERVIERAYREGHCDGRYFVTSGEFSTEEIDWQKSDARAAIAAQVTE